MTWLIQRQDRFEELRANRIGMGREVTAIAAGSLVSDVIKLATGTRDRGFQVWRFNKDNQLENVISVIAESVPIGLRFLATAAEDVCYFGLETGKL